VGLVMVLLGVMTSVDGAPPATQSVQQAADAKAKHDSAIVEAGATLFKALQKDQEVYHNTIVAADQQYVAYLDTALKAAISAQQIKLVQILEDEKKAAQAALQADQSEDAAKVAQAVLKAQQDAAADAGPHWDPPQHESVSNQKIAFVCDASGSMMLKFDPLRVELRKAIGPLKPPQSFQIIFFRQTGSSAVDPKGLLSATPESKRRAMAFVDKIAARGTNDPISALDMAFKQGAGVIFLLTDGDFPDNKAVLDEIHKLNPDKKVRINTIAFMDHDEEYEKLLRKIADDNGGTFRFVSEEEVKK
jgi:hypothetical protein